MDIYSSKAGVMHQAHDNHITWATHLEGLLNPSGSRYPIGGIIVPTSMTNTVSQVVRYRHESPQSVVHSSIGAMPKQPFMLDKPDSTALDG